jgi:hypothetical protein
MRCEWQARIGFGARFTSFGEADWFSAWLVISGEEIVGVTRDGARSRIDEAA